MCVLSTLATQLFHAALQLGILVLSYSEILLNLQKLDAQFSVAFLLLLVFQHLFLQLILQLILQLFRSLVAACSFLFCFLLCF